MVACSAWGCKNRSNKKIKHSFHTFPLKNKSLTKLWVNATKRYGFKPTKHSALCGDHFDKECFLPSNRKYKQLRKGVIPTIFVFPAHLQKKQGKPRSQRLTSPRMPESNLPVPELNLPMSEPKLSLPEINLPVPEIKLLMSKPNLPLPELNLPMSESNLPLPEFNLTMSKLNLPAPEFNLPMLKPNLPAPEFNLPMLKPNLPVPELNLPMPKLNIPAPEFNLPMLKPKLSLLEFYLSMPKPSVPSNHITIDPIIAEHNYSESVLIIKMKMNRLLVQNDQLKKKLKASMIREHQQNLKIFKLNDIIKDLKDKNLVKEQVEEILGY